MKINETKIKNIKKKIRNFRRNLKNICRNLSDLIYSEKFFVEIFADTSIKYELTGRSRNSPNYFILSYFNLSFSVKS